MVAAAVVCLVLATLWLLALRYGRDSRPGLRSEEEDLASLGVTWPDPKEPAPGRRPALGEHARAGYRTGHRTDTRALADAWHKPGL